MFFLQPRIKGCAEMGHKFYINEYLTHAIHQNTELSRAKSCLAAVPVHYCQKQEGPLKRKAQGSPAQSPCHSTQFVSVERMV